jgi:hypothetical protein
MCEDQIIVRINSSSNITNNNDDDDTAKNSEIED